MSFDPESQLFNMLDVICPGLDLPEGPGGGGPGGGGGGGGGYLTIY